MYKKIISVTCNIVGNKLSVGSFPQWTVESQDPPGCLTRSEPGTFARDNLRRLIWLLPVTHMTRTLKEIIMTFLVPREYKKVVFSLKTPELGKMCLNLHFPLNIYCFFPAFTCVDTEHKAYHPLLFFCPWDLYNHYTSK